MHGEGHGAIKSARAFGVVVLGTNRLKRLTRSTKAGGVRIYYAVASSAFSVVVMS